MSATSLYGAVDVSSGSAEVNQGTLLAGERNVDSSTNSYKVNRQECNATVLDGTSQVDVSAGAPAHLMGIFVKSGTPTVTIDGWLDQLGAAKSIAFTGAAGTFYDFKGARCEAELQVTSSVDDTVVVFWRPI